MDESKLAIKPLSEVRAEESAPDVVKVSNVPSELISMHPQVRASEVDIVAPLSFIGGTGGSYYYLWGWGSGKVVTRIRVYSGEGTIKAYTIWLSDSNGVTYGIPGDSNYAEYTFEDGERITKLTLWGNGAGTRAGWIEFTTSKGSTFSYGMYGWNRHTPYPVEVASGIMVGCIFDAASDIIAHGFYFINAIDYAQLNGVKYPTLTFDSASIVPEVLDHFQTTNDSTRDDNWDFSRTMKKSTVQSWSVTGSVTWHTTLSVQAGVPEMEQVKDETGWQISVASTYEASKTSEQEFTWSVGGVVKPGQKVDVKAVTKMGSLNIRYEATMTVFLKNGASFSYPIEGTYKGISYTGVEVVDNSPK